MRAERIGAPKPEPVFEPITIQVTFESMQEMDDLLDELTNSSFELYHEVSQARKGRLGL